MVLISLVRRTVARTFPSRIPLSSHAFYPTTTTFGLTHFAKMTTFTWVPNRYPPTSASDHVDVYKSESKGEVHIKDPYNWLETNSEETDKWTTAQADYAKEFIDQYQYRSELENQIRSNLDYEKFSSPVLKKDGRWYWTYNSGLQAQSVLYRSKDIRLPTLSKSPQTSPENEGEIFFDNNLITEDGTATVATSSFSHCGKYYAYGISLSGSDFVTIYVRSTESPFTSKEQRDPSADEGRLQDELRFVKFTTITWTYDSLGFFYQRVPDRESHGNVSDGKAGTETDRDENFILMYHRVGTPQSDDVLVMEDPSHPQYMWGTGISEIDGKYLELYVSKDTSRKNLLWLADLETEQIGKNISWIKVVDDFVANYTVLGNDGSTLYFLTDKDAPNRKIVTVDIADRELKWSDLIPEDKDAKLEHVQIVKDYFAIVYKRNVKDELYLYDLTGNQIERLAPEHVGTISISASREDEWFFAIMSGFTTPATIGHYDFTVQDEKQRWSIYRKTILKGLKTEDFSAEQVWFESKDGTKIPMFIVRHKSTPTDGTAPAIQYGYGGFSISIEPFFSTNYMTLLQRFRAVLAVPNIRGGGEFGEEWHLAGTRERKINVFDDFIGASQFLVKNKYAAPGKIAINGGSNGGLLVAACVNRASEGTFGAAVADVGVHDMLKFNKFTIGSAWTSDFGNPDDPHDFDFIYPYSPVHNVPKDKTLPPFLLLTADHDDRVVPLHSYKLAATLQNTLPHNPHPLLLRIDKKAGHGAGKSTDQRIKEFADKWSFVAQNLSLKWYTD